MENTMENMLGGMDAMVANIENESVNSVNNDKDAARKAARKEANQALVDCLKERIAKNPDFLSTVKTMSSSLEVLHTLTFSDKGNLVVDKVATAEKGQRTLKTVPAIVGYEVKNVGDQPIPYKTAVCTKGADGVYTEAPTDAVLNPGETAFLTRQYMTMLTAAPEFSFELANGKIVKGSGASRTGKSVREQLEAFYFAFKEAGKSVNDDSVVMPVGERVGDKWVVKPEFEATFGFLNNPKPVAAKGTRARKSDAEKIDTSTYLANFVYTVTLSNK